MPVRSEVAMLRRPTALPRGGAIEQHLVVILIGRRWVGATGAPPPLEMWCSSAISPADAASAG